MRPLLFLTNHPLWPEPLNGGDLRPLRILECLARSHMVHVVARVNPGTSDPGDSWLPADAKPQSLQIVRGLRKHDQHGMLRHYPWGSKTSRLLLPLVPGVPLTFKSGVSQSFVVAIREARKRLGDVLVWAGDLTTAEMARGCGFTKIIVDLDDFEADIWLGQLDQRPATMSSRVHRFEASRASRFERSAHRRFSAVAVAKVEDVVKFGGDGCDRIAIVPNGIDPPVAALVRNPAASSFLFIGTLGFDPNFEAIRSLFRSIFPRIRETLPDATLTIAGKGPMKFDFRSELGPGITLLQSPHSLTELYARAEIAILPVRFGGGTRIKVIEAWAHGVPVVATSLCVSGLNAVEGVHYVRAETDDEFVHRSLELHASSEKRSQLVEAGREMAESLTWHSALSGLDSIIEAIAKREGLE